MNREKLPEMPGLVRGGDTAHVHSLSSLAHSTKGSLTIAKSRRKAKNHY